MKMILKMALMILVTGVLQKSFAQSKEFDNVVEVSLERTVTIKNNNNIVGYALFYKVDKMKKSALYRLEILDENLKSIGSNEFEGSKELILLDAVYESEHIMLAFSDPKKVDDYDKHVRIYDLKGKQTGLVSYDPEKVRKGMMSKAVAETMQEYYSGYNNVDGKGFVVVYQSKAKTGGADIQFIDKTGKLKWEKNLTAERGDRMDLYLTATTPNALIFFNGARENLMAKDSKNSLLGLDPETGKEIFSKPMEVGEYAWEPMLFKTDNNNNYKLISTLSHAGDKFYTAKPIGFNIADINDKTGEIRLVKNFTYENDLSSVLNMKNESKSEDGYIQIHDISLMADGSTVMVGEFFRRTVSALGLAEKILSHGSATASQITIGDLFLLRIDKNNKPVSIEKIEKAPVRQPAFGDGISLGLTQRVMKMNGDFGYLYTDEGADPNKRTIIVEGTFEGERYGTNAITFDETKGYKLKKFTIQKDKNEKLLLRRAKPGHMLVMKYNPKQKKISMNLERID